MPELERLAAVCYQYPPRDLGGPADVERSLRELRRKRLDLELTLYAMNHPGREDTPEAFGRLVVSLLDQPAALRTIAERGRADVLHTFTWSASVHSALATYREAVNDRPGAGHRGALVPRNRAARHGG